MTAEEILEELCSPYEIDEGGTKLYVEANVIHMMKYYAQEAVREDRKRIMEFLREQYRALTATGSQKKASGVDIAIKFITQMEETT